MLMNFSSHLAIYRWQPAAWLRVTGSDAAAFLQGQFTNELRDVTRSATYGLWLNVKGKVLADSFVIRSGLENEFWIGSYFSAASVIRDRLEAYVIADDVTIEDQTADWSGLTVLTENAGELLTSTQMPALGCKFPGRRSRAAHLEWMFPQSAIAMVQEFTRDSRELAASDLLRFRIEAGIPAVPMDIGSGDLPNEGGLEEDAISYTKGCYLGQEVMARLKSMGQIRRRLLRVAGIRATVPTLPAPLFVGNRQVGELRSAVSTPEGLQGLAMLTLMHLQNSPRLALAVDGEATLAVLDRP
jgi:folate-binding protein YgfZ